eukprot:TRINITY_DN23512_c0_g1_i1.p1 TRINITY_DN23512_c0_g1~~TRINITY_DN23512_c0_g1_i1.p1  ORF type:complete len:380 (+),score=58.40 TRINITY_DN23512_c0_g1_i1:220-1359(+)
MASILLRNKARQWVLFPSLSRQLHIRLGSFRPCLESTKTSYKSQQNTFSILQSPHFLGGCAHSQVPCLYSASQLSLFPVKSKGSSFNTRRGFASDGVKQSEAPKEPPGGTEGTSEEEPKSGPKRRAIRTGPVTWGSLLLLLLTGAGLLFYYDTEKKRKLEAVKVGKPVGKAAIGGPFTLLDGDGKETTEQDLKGEWNVVYFGFTNCPDICPDELNKLAAAVDIVERKGGVKIRPVFISIDPERDTVEQVRLYVKEFHPRLVGLTGSPEAVRAAARQYRVYYMKTDEEEDGNYLVDHSIIMYLMDPKMDFVKFFGKNYTAEGLAEGIIEEIREAGGLVRSAAHAAVSSTGSNDEREQKLPGASSGTVGGGSASQAVATKG